jgi:hypothetical protein
LDESKDRKDASKYLQGDKVPQAKRVHTSSQLGIAKHDPSVGIPEDGITAKNIHIQAAFH